ncbi:DegT/DnrJ/EryC1/StrS family aminotransferase [Conexibacter sp. JD483]|uniref:DegT/DnrJ/EryC1/StrS family aminotransferase n=1 Tax=unclassified Conexibacter TaxID=2627773 RepID=UPI002720064D|nr:MULTISPECIES: DegT/DnrJ/EryC1/StrS family aminotransferase [unclassified Conexibacter]MDO8188240.1 DegT/DnrJ/EryC1/StrS family aminotransferase [Conexibacter sp. CPCC 205706]MDO8201907.1 DegT/DnrJ/EryC1/StrS family aminotransferase [Conexibacter sp. CPCC 205762]MDR9370794.1 DegT/DnrJ/EryC1/StrS family aminotransferase [Conexibacter sp. JD483]
MAIPLFDTRRPVAPLRAELDAAIASVLDSGAFILGPEVAAFEQELAGYLGVRHVVSVANGTDAITLALQALGVGPGDEVVVPSFTFYASAEAIPPTGAAPVFCDVDPATMNVTAETVKAALTPRTKAVVAVDLFGNPADVAAIEALGVPVVEDAAQAAGSRLHGRRSAAQGTLGTLSFFPSKNLGCFGDGGAIVTDDERLAEEARVLRFHGSRDKVTFERIGWNSRLDELQAAILRVLLRRLDDWAEGRRAAWANYEAAGLWELVTPQTATPGAEVCWGLQVVTSPHAELLERELPAHGVGARGYYRTPLHEQVALRPWAERTVPLPATDELKRTHLALPMNPLLSRADADEVTAAVRAVLATAA